MADTAENADEGNSAENKAEYEAEFAKSKFKNVVSTNVKLQISLKTFEQYYIANDAKFSFGGCLAITINLYVINMLLLRYHELEKDLNVVTNPWEPDDVPKWQKREINYMKIVGLPGLAQTRAKQV